MTSVVRKYDIGIVGSGPVGLVLSSLLSHYGVNHVLIERRLHPVVHPQAHFLNARTMEILQLHCPKAHNRLLKQLQKSYAWREFSYCHTLTGTQLHRIDHFKETPRWFWQESPSNIAHLAQNKVEVALREEVIHATAAQSAHHMLGYNVTGVEFGKDGSIVTARGCAPGTEDQTVQVACKYLVAADGSNSFIRAAAGIAMKGDEAMQHLVNVHFSCPGLRSQLQPNTAMLYFTFNEAVVAVFVAHDASSDEWVCQIPFFPPFQTLQDFTPEEVQRLLKAAIFGSSASALPIHVKSVNSWVMHAQVAAQYDTSSATAKSGAFGNVFLVGDAAHRFPPAGGFGMNTGIQDAHNLAWKLAMATHIQAAPSLLNTYEKERKPVAEANTALSKFNYGLTAGLARALGVDPDLAAAAVSASDSSLTKSLVPFAMRKAAVLKALQTGLYSLKWLKDWSTNVLGGVRVRALKNLVLQGKSLPLIFPEADLGFIYRAGAVSREETIAGTKDGYAGVKLAVGGRIPHCWLVPPRREEDREIQLLDGISCYENMNLAVSTVQLSLLMEKLAQTSVPHSTHASPAVTVVVNSCHAESAKAALRSNAQPYICDFNVISVRDTAGHTYEASEESPWQSLFQDPLYRMDVHSKPETLGDQHKLQQRYADVWAGRKGVGYEKSDNKCAGALELEDVDAKWRMHCERHAQAWWARQPPSSRGERQAARHSDVVVFLRPDGHVAHIAVLRGQEPEEVQREISTALRRTAEALHLYRTNEFNG